MKKKACVSAVVVLIFLCFLSDLHGQESGLFVKGNLRILALEGTPFERGLKHGKALSEDIHRLVGLWKASLERSYETRADIFIERFLEGTNYREAIEKWTPELWKELEGISKGAGIDIDTLFAFQLVDEIWVLGRDIQADHCTTVGRKRDGRTPSIIGQNLDIPGFYHGFQTVLYIKEPHRDLDTLVFTFPGFIAANGLNDHSVGVAVNAVQQLENSRDGLPVAFVIRGILARKTYEEAVRFIKTIKHGAPQNYLIGGVDEVGSFECSATRVVPFVPFDGADFTFHTNHPLSNLDYNPNFLKFLRAKQISPEEYVHPCRRFQALQRILNDNTARVDVDTLKSLFSARETGINNGGTFGCTIMVLGDEPELHISPGRPDERPFEKFKFHYEEQE